MRLDPGSDPPDSSVDSARVGGRRWALRLEAALWLAAATLLGTVAWTLADAALFQRSAAARLERAWAAESSGVAPTVAAVATGPIASGTPLARLSIPRLGASAVVAEGVEEPVLRRALGHLPESARPGESGNIALAGHRDTFFRALEGVEVGDEVLLESGAGRERYRVEWAAVVDPAQVTVARDSGYPALTLLTCYPFGYVGDAPYRYVIRARRVEDARAAGRRSG